MHVKSVFIFLLLLTVVNQGQPALAFEATDVFPASACTFTNKPLPATDVSINMRRGTLLCETAGAAHCNKISCPIPLIHPRRPDRLKSVEVFFANSESRSVVVQLCLQHLDRNAGPFRCVQDSSTTVGETSVVFDSGSLRFANFKKFTDGFAAYIRPWLKKGDRLFSYKVTWDLPCGEDPDACP